MPSDRSLRTRALLQDTATRLFTEQGYEATTVEQIAREAGVSHMTFFRHFPTKEAVVLDDGFDPAIAAAIAAAPDTLAPLARICAGFRLALANVALPAADDVRRRVRIAALNPTLRAGIVANNEATSAAIAQALVADGAGVVESRVAAAAAMAAMSVAMLEWGLSDDPAEAMAARLGAALDVLDGGVS